ncbi:GTPase HflX [Pseudochelatococcus sp. G4_1912]|uniref:GTPase HflX n=1 Tax=Pseudochelatococcus sp. G4_1912 TaxID=3114288 RepID=UPI0039C75AC0
MSLTEQQAPTASGTRTFVVGPYLTRRKVRVGTVPLSADELASARDPEARMEEAIGLARAIELEVVRSIILSLDAVRPSTFLGKGRVEEITEAVKAEEIGLVVMDCALSPVQQRNLERAWGVKVIDRTGLILEIFGSRAHTREGTLQVELAHLTYQKSRLVRSWTHLERQRGGFGFLGGPGETQIEADRRIILERMTRLERDLDTVKRTRSLHRASRRRVPYPIVALVGYTNAGKSTLFNRLSSAEVMAEDMLFATLDPTARSVKLPHGGKAILSDTVGFISDLPTMLVAAFRATLEDVIEADVLLHVRDVSHGDTQAQAADVNAILHELGIDDTADAENGGRIIEVWNKVDLLNEDERTRLINIAEGRSANQRPVLISAQTGEGTERLLAAIEARIAKGRRVYLVNLQPTEGALLNWLHEETEVLERRTDAEGRLMVVVRIAPEKEPRLLNRCPDARAIR